MFGQTNGRSSVDDDLEIELRFVHVSVDQLFVASGVRSIRVGCVCVCFEHPPLNALDVIQVVAATSIQATLCMSFLTVFA